MSKNPCPIPGFLVACLISLLLTACGGGGGGGGGGDSSTPTASLSEYSLSGTITAAADSAIDSDTNDPKAPYTANDDTGQAQPLPNPVILGGFVTKLPTGDNGDRFGVSADPYDVFAISLVSGQYIELTISDWGQNGTDLDLFLLDATDPDNPRVVDASAGSGATETLAVPSTGPYFLIVEAISGDSNYLLSVGNVDTSATPSGMRLSAEFVPGEAIVRLHPPGKSRDASTRALPPGLSPKAGNPDRAMLMKIAGRPPAADLSVSSDTPSSLPAWRATLTNAQQQRLDTIHAVKKLRREADVEGAGLNYILRPHLVPDDPDYAWQWHYPMLNLPQAWDLTTGTPQSGEVVVAVVDTGVFLGHDDLQGQLVAGYDFISDPGYAADGDGIDPDPDDPGTEILPGTSLWHGTHVAGTVAAGTNNTAGVAGVSWGARVMPVRVLGRGGSGTMYDVMQGVRYAAGLPNDAGRIPAEVADIVNLSLGCSACYLQEFQDLVTRVRNAGVIIIASAGNESSSNPSYPAAFDGVISVAALKPDGTRAAYSNFGTSIDVAAPGGDGSRTLERSIRSCWVDDTSGSRQTAYISIDGTSMAAPHMAGVAALMKAVYPGLTPGDLDSLLASRLITVDLGTPGRDNLYGWGRIDALMAVYAAQDLAAGGGASPGVLVTDPTALDFGLALNDLGLVISNPGDTAISVSLIEVSAPWLNISPTGVDASGLGSYTVSVDRSSLADAAYSASIGITSSEGEILTVPVSMRVGHTATASTGHLWVLLLDEDLNVIARTDVLPVSGRYSYRFPGIAPGNYFLGAGSDSDNDSLICDEGEACGTYPTLTDPQLIELATNRSRLNFVTTFSNTLTETSALTSAIPARGLHRTPAP